MRKVPQIILFLKSLATGTLAPVLTLTLLGHGASIRTLSLLLGVYSGIVILAEFPTGLFADLYGRKKAFILAAVFQLLSLGTVLVSRSVLLLLPAMVLFGLGRAFSSGSLDALAIDDAVENGADLARVSARLSMLESAGLAIGALTGGFLAGLLPRYEANILVNLAVTLLLVLTGVSVREKPFPKTDSPRPGMQRIRSQIRESLSFLSRKGTVRMLVLLSGATGFALLSLETYWQPALAGITADTRIFGVIGVLGFAGAIAGSKLTEILLAKRSKYGTALALGFKGIMGGGLALLAFQTRTVPFMGIYTLVYLFLGSGGVAETTLLNQVAPSEQRASILSLFSFVLQAGGLLASVCGYAVSAVTDFRAVWWLAAGLLVLCSVLTVPRRAGKPGTVRFAPPASLASPASAAPASHPAAWDKTEPGRYVETPTCRPG